MTQTDGSCNSEQLPLTEKQRAIVNAAADARLMVLAPPGTGKTHTVIARIQYLIEQEGLMPFQLAVLCFTRAAVSEILGRINTLVQSTDLHDDLRFVSVRTFDSYATLLLINADSDRNLGAAGYNARIKLAADALSDTNSPESLMVSNCHHLIVDEIQDLVGVRDRFVRLMLQRINGGFTLLGDPAQGIYGFAEEEENDIEEKVTLIDWVRNNDWNGGLVELSLGKNHRSSGETAAIADLARAIVLDENPDRESLAEMHELMSWLGTSGSGLHPDCTLSDSKYDSVGILCRTNGELLRVGSMLDRNKIDFYIKPRAEEYALPAWIGRILGTFDSARISSSFFENRWSSLIGEDKLIEPQQAFGWLKRLEGSQGSDLNIRGLHNKLFRGFRLPDEATADHYTAGRSIVLSTIHASKGREYDHVIVLESNKRNGAKHGREMKDEAKILYVAATRAREVLSMLKRDGIPSHLRPITCANGQRRWVSKVSNKRNYMEIGIPGDIDTDSFVSTYIHHSQNEARSSQDLLWHNIIPGMPLFIHQEWRKRYAFYRIRPHESLKIGNNDFAQLSLSFKKGLTCISQQLRPGDRIQNPRFWSGVRVSRLVTEVLPPYPEHVNEPFATSGFCLGIRIKDMIQI